MHRNLRPLHSRHPPLLPRNRQPRAPAQRTRRNSPAQPSKHRARTRNIAHLAKADPATEKHRQRHEARKPEQHAQGVERDEAPAESGGREEVRIFQGDEQERDECGEGPDGAE